MNFEPKMHLRTQFRLLGEMFCFRMSSLQTVWKYIVMPPIDELADLAERNVMIMGDGSRVQLRKVPQPGLPSSDARKLGAAMDQAGVMSFTGDEEAELRVLRDFLGEDLYQELVREGEQVHSSLVEFAGVSRREMIQLGYVKMNHMMEWFYTEIGACVGVTVWRNRGELTDAIARWLGVTRIEKLQLPGREVEELVRLIANDVKHNDGVAVKSARRLGIKKGRPLVLQLSDLEQGGRELNKYALALADVMVDRLGLQSGWEAVNVARVGGPSPLWIARFSRVLRLPSVQGSDG